MLSETTPGLRREQRRRLLWVLAISALIGAAFGAFLSLTFGAIVPGRLFASALIGVVQATLTAGGIAGFEILLRDWSAVRRLRAMPFLAIVLVKTIVYSAIILTVQQTKPGQRLAEALLGGAFVDQELASSVPTITTGFSLAVALAFVLTLQVAQVVGGRALRDLVLGRYRRPREERRFFLFVDVVGSTALAEKLGALGAHQFLSAVFAAVAEPIAACRGEI